MPVGKLSERDRLILDGMGKGKYRTYPMRKGEKLSDVLSKRKITLKEFEDLNPGVNPDKIQGATFCTFSISSFSVWILLQPVLMTAALLGRSCSFACSWKHCYLLQLLCSLCKSLENASRVSP